MFTIHVRVVDVAGPCRQDAYTMALGQNLLFNLPYRECNAVLTMLLAFVKGGKESERERKRERERKEGTSADCRLDL